MYSQQKYSNNALEVYRHFKEQSKIFKYQKLIETKDFSGVTFDKEQLINSEQMKKLAENPSGKKLFDMVINKTAETSMIENESEYSEEIHTYRYEPLCKEISIQQASTPAFARSLSVVSYQKPEESKVEQKEEEVKFEQITKAGFKTEAFIKFVIRKFRETIKKNFQKEHGNKYNFWIPSTLRANVKKFFTEYSNKRQNYMIPEHVYDQNEAIFFKLVINTKKNSQVDQFKGNKQIVEEMEQIFRSAPKIAYLQRFFKNESVQYLYTIFKSCDNSIIEKIKELSVSDRAKLIKHAQKIQPDGFEILPIDKIWAGLVMIGLLVKAIGFQI